MKSTRRHELQENALAIELSKVVEFLKKRANHIATGVLVVALLIFAYVFIQRRARGAEMRLQRQWDRALNAEMAPEERIGLLTTLAEQEDDERIAALAGVELGYEYSRQALVAPNAGQKAALRQKAGQWFLVTTGKFQDQDIAVAKALLGLARLRASAGNLKQAVEDYRKIQALEGARHTPAAQLAAVALQELKQWQQQGPVRLATTMPSTSPATQPGTRPAAATAPATAPAGP